MPRSKEQQPTPVSKPGSRSESRRSSPVSSPGESDEFVERIAQRVYELMGGKVQQEPQLPLEDVELVGEKVNYKIALNPEIFYRYSVFKARIEASGKKWEGSLDMVQVIESMNQSKATRFWL